MMLPGAPDWNAAAAFDGHPAFAAWERPGTFLVPPTALVARAFDGAPGLALDRYRQDRDRDGLAEFSLLSLAFAVETPLSTVQETSGAQGLAFRAMRAERGWVRLDPVGALDLPDDVRALQPLDIANGASLALGVRLDAVATELFLGALRRGMGLIQAEAWCRMRGVAARHPLALPVDPVALLAGIRALAGDGDSTTVPLDALRSVLLDAPARVGLPALGDVPERERAQAVQATIDRCAARFAEPVPAARGNDVALAFDPARMAPGQLRWRLDDVLLAPRLFALAADPLGPLRNGDAATLESRVVRDHVAPALDSGWHAIAVNANLPARRAGLLRTQVELAAAAKPPMRPFASKASLPLPDGRTPGIATLRLAPTEPLAYQWRTHAFISEGGRVVALPGPERSSDRRLLVIGPDDFGVAFVSIDIERAFLDQATVALEARGTRQGRPWSLAARLDKEAPAIAFAVPADVQDGTLVAIAEALDGGARASMAPAALQSCTLDAFSFEGSGARALDVRCVFDDARAQALVEVVPDGREGEASRVRLLRLTPNAPNARWTWTALSPLRPGYRWRWAGSAAWSDAMSPGSPLTIHSSKAPGSAQGAKMERSIDGVALSPVPGEAHVWRYRAQRPDIATGGGTAQFSLISAAGIHMLSLTTVWGVDGTRLEAVRGTLAAEAGVDPACVELRPMPCAVGDVTLRFGDGAGGWEDAAQTQSSGMPPYHAAFSLMLDDAKSDKVRRAIDGESGLFGVAYAWTANDGPRTETTSLDAASLRIDASLDSADASATASSAADVSIEHAATTGGGSTAGVAFADAATWRMHPP